MMKEGGALWWAATLKSPEEMQNTKSLKVSMTSIVHCACNNLKLQVFRMKGLSYEGVVDITKETKETGQALKAHLTGGSETGVDVSFFHFIFWFCFFTISFSGPLAEKIHWGEASSRWRALA